MTDLHVRTASIAILALTVLLGGCATPERVVLLPEAGGKSTAITVTGKTGSAVLAEPYAQAIVSANETTTGRVDADWVSTRYGEVMKATPAPPQKLLLYFASGSNELTPESARLLATIRRELAARPAPELLVIGHTDRVGTLEANDALSAKRAEFIRDQLVTIGIAAGMITTIGRGEREPLVATGDEVAEPANRRVEVKIR